MGTFKTIGKPNIEEQRSQGLRGPSVGETHPALVDDKWDFHGNNDKPHEVGPGSSRKERFFCNCKEGQEHTFEQLISRVTRAYDHDSRYEGCPTCSGRIPLEGMSLAVARPDLVKEWYDYRRLPQNVSTLSHWLAQWKCALCGHIYRTTVSTRASLHFAQGCPNCYDGTTVDLSEQPEALELYDRTANNRGFHWRRLPPSFKVCWRCPLGHKRYESFLSLEARNFKCYHCSEENVPLANFPDLVAQIHPEKNGDLDPTKIPAGSHQMVTWLCSVHPSHEWRASVTNRVFRSSRCPYCSNKRVCVTNSLEKHPLVARELHPFKNDGLTPAQIIERTNKKCWWQCHFCGHEWERAVRLRIERGSACPRCRSNTLDAPALLTSVRKKLESGDPRGATPDQHDSTHVGRGSAGERSMSVRKALARTTPPKPLQQLMRQLSATKIKLKKKRSRKGCDWSAIKRESE